MASQHVFLVQHEAFGLTSLKKRKTEKLGAGGEARSGLVAKIVDFVHPRTGNICVVPRKAGLWALGWAPHNGMNHRGVYRACVRLMLCCRGGPSGPVDCLEPGCTFECDANEKLCGVRQSASRVVLLYHEEDACLIIQIPIPLVLRVLSSSN